jgi:hypothetical protein
VTARGPFGKLNVAANDRVMTDVGLCVNLTGKNLIRGVDGHE